MNDKCLMFVFNQDDCYDMMKGSITNIIKAQRVVLKPPFRLYICCGKGDMMQLHKDGSTVYTQRGYGDNSKRCASRVIGYADVIAVDTINYTQGSYEIADELIQTCGHTKDTLCKYGRGRTLHLWKLDNINFYEKPISIKNFIKVCKHPEYCEMCEHAYRIYSSDVESSADLPGAFYKLICVNRLQSPPPLYCYVRRLQDE